MFLQNRITKLERESGCGGRKIAILEGNDLTDWAALEQRYFEEYGRTPEDGDLIIHLINSFSSSEPDPGRILQVLDAPE